MVRRRVWRCANRDAGVREPLAGHAGNRIPAARLRTSLCADGPARGSLTPASLAERNGGGSSYLSQSQRRRLPLVTRANALHLPFYLAIPGGASQRQTQAAHRHRSTRERAAAHADSDEKRYEEVFRTASCEGPSRDRLRTGMCAAEPQGCDFRRVTRGALGGQPPPAPSRNTGLNAMLNVRAPPRSNYFSISMSSTSKTRVAPPGIGPWP